MESPATGLLKIGHSTVGALRRMRQAMTFCPDPDLRLVAVLKGAGDRETDVHRAFAASHSHGEWFFASDDLRRWVSGGCSLGELPQQLKNSNGIRHQISKRHNPRHVDGLLEHMQKLRKH